MALLNQLRYGMQMKTKNQLEDISSLTLDADLVANRVTNAVVTVLERLISQPDFLLVEHNNGKLAVYKESELERV